MKPKRWRFTLNILTTENTLDPDEYKSVLANTAAFRFKECAVIPHIPAEKVREQFPGLPIDAALLMSATITGTVRAVDEVAIYQQWLAIVKLLARPGRIFNARWKRIIRTAQIYELFYS
jgi:hypothetical protein